MGQNKITHINKINENCAVMNGKIYDIEPEVRGKRPKFWIGDKLFKQNLNNTTMEAEAEVLASVIANNVGYPAVEYEIATMEYQNQTYKGVLSLDYRSQYSGDISEFSGKTIMDIYKASMYDNARGKSVSPANTIDFYTTAINSLFKSEKKDNIRQSLLGLATLDYVFSQSDRHMYNVCFIKENDTIHVAPTFDNGAMCLFNYGEKKLNNIASSLSNLVTKSNDKRKVQNFLTNTVHSNVMLGIHTPTSIITQDTTSGSVTNQFINDNSLQDQFVTELAYETSQNNNPIYDKLLNLDMEKVFGECEEKGCVISPELKEYVTIIFNDRMDTLDKTMQKIDKTYTSKHSKEHSKGEIEHEINS